MVYDAKLLLEVLFRGGITHATKGRVAQETSLEALVEAALKSLSKCVVEALVESLAKGVVEALVEVKAEAWGKLCQRAKLHGVAGHRRQRRGRCDGRHG